MYLFIFVKGPMGHHLSFDLFSSLLSAIQGLVYLFLSPLDTLATCIHFDVSRDFWINVSHQTRITCSTWLHLSHQSLIFPESRACLNCLSAIETYRKRSIWTGHVWREPWLAVYYSRMTSSYRIKRKPHLEVDAVLMLYSCLIFFFFLFVKPFSHVFRYFFFLFRFFETTEIIVHVFSQSSLTVEEVNGK